MADKLKLDVTEFHNNIAPGYDRVVNSSITAAFIRNYFCGSVLSTFKPGSHILEIGCGTGTDSVFFARNGIKMTSTDISPEMLKITAKKAQDENLTGLITPQIVDANNLDPLNGNLFDGIISNFNALNYVNRLEIFSENASNLLKPGAGAVFVMLNKVCLWEFYYNLLKLKPVTAFERLLSREKYYKTHMNLYFPRKAGKIFSKYFMLKKITGFGFLYPPDGLSAFQQRHINFFNSIKNIENFLCSKYPFYNFCDHYLIEMTRK